MRNIPNSFRESITARKWILQLTLSDVDVPGMFQVASAIRSIPRYTASSNLTGFCERFRSPLATVCLRQFQQLPLQLQVIYSIFFFEWLIFGSTLCQFLCPFPFSFLFQQVFFSRFLVSGPSLFGSFVDFLFSLSPETSFLASLIWICLFLELCHVYFVSLYVFFNFSELSLLFLSLFSLFHLLVVKKPSRLWIHFLGLLIGWRCQHLHLLYCTVKCTAVFF